MREAAKVLILTSQRSSKEALVCFDDDDDDVEDQFVLATKMREERGKNCCAPEKFILSDSQCRVHAHVCRRVRTDEEREDLNHTQHQLLHYPPLLPPFLLLLSLLLLVVVYQKYFLLSLVFMFLVIRNMKEVLFVILLLPLMLNGKEKNDAALSLLSSSSSSSPSPSSSNPVYCSPVLPSRRRRRRCLSGQSFSQNTERRSAHKHTHYTHAHIHTMLSLGGRGWCMHTMSHSKYYITYTRPPLPRFWPSVMVPSPVPAVPFCLPNDRQRAGNQQPSIPAAHCVNDLFRSLSLLFTNENSHRIFSLSLLLPSRIPDSDSSFLFWHASHPSSSFSPSIRKLEQGKVDRSSAAAGDAVTAAAVSAESAERYKTGMRFWHQLCQPFMTKSCRFSSPGSPSLYLFTMQWIG